MEAQRWRRDWAAGGVGPEFGGGESGRERCGIDLECCKAIEIKCVVVGDDIGSEPIAGGVDAAMGCGGGRFFVRRQVVACWFGEMVTAFTMLVISMLAMMAHAGRRFCVCRSSAMIAATEDAVREHVQAGQDGDQGSHVELEGNRMSVCRRVSPLAAITV